MLPAAVCHSCVMHAQVPTVLLLSHVRHACTSANSGTVRPAGKVLHQILYAMYSSDRAVQQRVATALARLAATADLKTVLTARKLCSCIRDRVEMLIVGYRLHATAVATEHGLHSVRGMSACWSTALADVMHMRAFPAGICRPAGAAGPGGHADGRQVRGAAAGGGR